MLVDRNRQRMRLAPALGWSFTWALGAAIGVALGGYLTLVSGVGAPGQVSLDPTTDLIVLPLAAFVIVLVLHLGGQVLAAVLRSRRANPVGDSREQDQERAE